MAKIKPSLLKGLVKEIGLNQKAIITSYQLGKMIFNAYVNNHIGGIDLNLKKSLPEKTQYNLAVNDLINTGVLTNFAGLSGNYYKVFGITEVSAEEVICSIDPFCYISHLSAMAHHGITDRLPRTIFVSSPTPREWKSFAIDLMKKDLGDLYTPYIDRSFPQLYRTRPKKIAGSLIEFKSSIHLGAFKKIQGTPLRVSTIGRTFLDMLRSPELCGGMQHVLDVYADYSQPYIKQIIDEIDSYGKDIEKARAGFILENIVKKVDPRIEVWQNSVQRGGSRKLDPSNEYSPFFSEKWGISLNLPSISSNAN